MTAPTREPDHHDADDRGRSADRPTEVPATGWKDVAKRVNEQRKQLRTVLLASGVAFWFFLSLFPALIAAATIFGLVLDPDDVADRVEDGLDALPEEAQTLVSEQLETISGAGGTALGIGLLVSVAAALWAASAAITHLMEAVNAIYHEHDDRNFVKKKGLALLLTLGALVFGALAFVAIAAVPALVRAADLPGGLELLAWPVLAAVFAGGLAVVYRYGPDRASPQWKWVTPGALIAVVVWLVGSVLFQFYVANFGNYQETYGALSAVVILLLWLLLTALSVLLGAHVNAELEAQTTVDTTGDDRPLGRREAYVADHVGRPEGEAEPARRRPVDLPEGQTAGPRTTPGGREASAASDPPPIRHDVPTTRDTSTTRGGDASRETDIDTEERTR